VRLVESSPETPRAEEARLVRARDRGGRPQGRRRGRRREALTGPPLLVLGVRRSGTTLLRVMLDRHSELAIPDESYFIPQLADRPPPPRISATVAVAPSAAALRGLPPLGDGDVRRDGGRARLRPGMRVGEAVAAVYETYAARHGKTRWGDKTPMYMQRLRML